MLETAIAIGLLVLVIYYERLLIEWLVRRWPRLNKWFRREHLNPVTVIAIPTFVLWLYLVWLYGRTSPSPPLSDDEAEVQAEIYRGAGGRRAPFQ